MFPASRGGTCQNGKNAGFSGIGPRGGPGTKGAFMPGCVRYPAPGCIVEYMEGNAVQIAMVTEEVGGRLRLLLPNRRETRAKKSPAA